jgi:hypothetical protein
MNMGLCGVHVWKERPNITWKQAWFSHKITIQGWWGPTRILGSLSATHC